MSGAKAFLEFVNKTGSPYHSVEACKALLREAGFTHLREAENWGSLKKGNGYFFTRNNSAICAFVVGKEFTHDNAGFVVWGAHTDSPCLRLRPKSNVHTGGMVQLGIECYGGGLWHTWFDRGLGFAGKVVYKPNDNPRQPGLREALVRVDKPVCIVPSLAIHLSSDRNAFNYNTESHLRPVLGSTDSLVHVADDQQQRITTEVLQIIAEQVGTTPDMIVDVDVCLFDAQPGQLIGLKEEFVNAGRLDNLVSTFSGVKGIIEASKDANPLDVAMFCAFDHEECGSESWTGASSSSLKDWMKRIFEKIDADNAGSSTFEASLRRSILFSADMAHASHPNYAEKHQDQHRPIINKGIVIKANGNQRYATHAVTAAYVRNLAAIKDLPVQDFVVRNDSPCGSTIGPIISAHVGMRAVDIGMPQWAMHSIRETCGAKDIQTYSDFAATAFRYFRSVDFYSEYLDDGVEGEHELHTGDAPNGAACAHGCRH